MRDPRIFERQVSERIAIEAIILAGGKGTRLGARLEGIPKPMVHVGNRPFLERLLDRLDAAGCKRVILSVGYLQSVIRDYFGQQYRSVSIEYSAEDEPLGTGGAIRLALGKAHEPNILLLNGDTFLDVNYQELLQFHTSYHSDLTVAVIEQENTLRFGGVTIEADRIVSFAEKGRSGRGWINGGVYAIKSRITWPNHLADNFSFETDFLIPELRRLKPLAFRCSGYFLDIGVPEDLDRAQSELHY